VTAADALSAKAGREMLARFAGQPRWSLANWLALRQPRVIFDEAHNTKTERSFEALKRLNPSLILALTATPTPKRSNVLFHVSAQQLQAEHMIKMPITLIEHTRSWQAAVFDAVQNQRLLEALSQQEEAEPGPNQGSYLRPIVLLQAQNSGDPVNVDVLRAHLVDELQIPADPVVVATGTERGLAGLDLASRACTVRYIITVQALREGWDCPFAYILCAVQAIRSATAVAQLLGRVLRDGAGRAGTGETWGAQPRFGPGGGLLAADLVRAVLPRLRLPAHRWAGVGGRVQGQTPARRAQGDRETSGGRGVGRAQRRPSCVCDGLQAGARHDDGSADRGGAGLVGACRPVPCAGRLARRTPTHPGARYRMP
jgi:hypothetical protein